VLFLNTRKPCCRRETARCRCKFSSIRRVQAANDCESRHFEFDRTRNSAIRSIDHENHTIEPNIEWIGSPFADIWPLHITMGAFKTPILKGGRRRSSIVPLQRAMVVSYTSKQTKLQHLYIFTGSIWFTISVGTYA